MLNRIPLPLKSMLANANAASDDVTIIQ
jgi:hypothetical protein